ncbi:MAG: hypothetical protein MZV63_72490 [Marinilabiliales bacterium]|nr:hypothetical protein [Marinilabiliales bacterium]
MTGGPARSRPEVRVWYNPELAVAQFLVPGLIGLHPHGHRGPSRPPSPSSGRRSAGPWSRSWSRPAGRCELIVGKIVPYARHLALASAHLVLAPRLGPLRRRPSGAATSLLLLAMLLFLVGALGSGPPHLHHHPDPAGGLPAGRPDDHAADLHPVRASSSRSGTCPPSSRP